ncbi:unnamed protein product [Adineta steineri]|uniref:Uncharacterized protein n=1 Tax=Adineta steineri TaxID=433720 RepID=A0A813M164_9BILA|nr:unnamed protein product [Adineta steineri]
MAASKRLHSSLLNREKHISTSTNTFIESLLIPSTSISQTTENHLDILKDKENSQDNQLVDLQQLTFQLKQQQDEKSKLSHETTKNKYKNANITKTIVDETQNNNEDDWVLTITKKYIYVISYLYIQICPVAVALRRAGYNVPLRPSKSWLERGS